MCNCTSEVWSFGPSRNDGLRLPDGQISDFLSSPFCKNILIYRNKNQSYIYSCSAPRGALAIVTDVGQDAVDADGAEDEGT
jgi:hypothetical protein